MLLHNAIQNCKSMEVIRLPFKPYVDLVKELVLCTEDLPYSMNPKEDLIYATSYSSTVSVLLQNNSDIRIWGTYVEEVLTFHNEKMSGIWIRDDKSNFLYTIHNYEGDRSIRTLGAKRFIKEVTDIILHRHETLFVHNG